jgi:8-oxo-dGTP pyrophosphatase MutT (NUDIX family)
VTAGVAPTTSGDGWTYCAQGHKHWGIHGAAGLLARHRDPGGTEWVLLQHRAAWSHHGGTWGIPGGARDLGESAEDAARREVTEESDLDVTDVRAAGEFVDDHGGWTYTTVALWLPAMAAVAVRGAESVEFAWAPVPDLGEMSLHPGFAASWPAVRSVGAAG